MFNNLKLRDVIFLSHIAILWVFTMVLYLYTNKEYGADCLNNLREYPRFFAVFTPLYFVAYITLKFFRWRNFRLENKN